jgi:hypothetical protein
MLAASQRSATQARSHPRLAARRTHPAPRARRRRPARGQPQPPPAWECPRPFQREWSPKTLEKKRKGDDLCRAEMGRQSGEEWAAECTRVTRVLHGASSSNGSTPRRAPLSSRAKRPLRKAHTLSRTFRVLSAHSGLQEQVQQGGYAATTSVLRRAPGSLSRAPLPARPTASSGLVALLVLCGGPAETATEVSPSANVVAAALCRVSCASRNRASSHRREEL